jgi:hypothetical protein
MTERYARASGRRRLLVVGLWLIVILTAFVLMPMFLSFAGEAEITRKTASKQAKERLPHDAVLSTRLLTLIGLKEEL